MMMAKAPAQRGLASRPWVWKTIGAAVIFIAGLSVGMSTERDAQCASMGSTSVAVTAR